MYNKQSWINKYAAIFRDLTVLATGMSIVLSFMIMILWRGFGHSIIESAGVATLKSVEENREAITSLGSRLAKITGTAKILSEVPDLTYIVEPAHVDQRVITFRMVASISDEYQNCSLENFDMVFVGEDSIRRTVEVQQSLNINSVPSPVEVDVPLPRERQAGRYVAWGSVKFACPSSDVFETTTSVVFRLSNPRPR